MPPGAQFCNPGQIQILQTEQYYLPNHSGQTNIKNIKIAALEFSHLHELMQQV